METAKVDIEKLQLLNDKINQTIEALNQVRMSVHGLQTARYAGQVPSAQFGSYGLSHSGIGGQIPGQNPWAQQFSAPFAQNPWAAQSPWAAAQSPWLQQFSGGYGLSHSGFDPYSRLVHTFPFLVTDASAMRQFY